MNLSKRVGFKVVFHNLKSKNTCISEGPLRLRALNIYIRWDRTRSLHFTKDNENYNYPLLRLLQCLDIVAPLSYYTTLSIALKWTELNKYEFSQPASLFSKANGKNIRKANYTSQFPSRYTQTKCRHDLRVDCWISSCPPKPRSPASGRAPPILGYLINLLHSRDMFRGCLGKQTYSPNGDSWWSWIPGTAIT